MHNAIEWNHLNMASLALFRVLALALPCNLRVEQTFTIVNALTIIPLFRGVSPGLHGFYAVYLYICSLVIVISKRASF